MRTTPLEETFKLYIIDNQTPRVVKDGKNYEAASL